MVQIGQKVVYFRWNLDISNRSCFFGLIRTPSKRVVKGCESYLHQYAPIFAPQHRMCGNMPNSFWLDGLKVVRLTSDQIWVWFLEYESMFGNYSMKVATNATIFSWNCTECSEMKVQIGCKVLFFRRNLDISYGYCKPKLFDHKRIPDRWAVTRFELYLRQYASIFSLKHQMFENEGPIRSD